MILLHLSNGTVVKACPVDDVEDLRVLDNRYVRSNLSSIAMINVKGGRIDLPTIDRRDSVWLDAISDGDISRGESVNIFRRGRCYKFSLFYSDGRFVVEFS